jgi:hypothetical protein
MLPNSQNLVSTINLSPDSVKISGKNIELDGNTRIAGGFALSADKISAGTLNGMTITGSTFVATANNINVEGHDLATCETKVDNSGPEVNLKLPPIAIVRKAFSSPMCCRIVIITFLQIILFVSSLIRLYNI